MRMRLSIALVVMTGAVAVTIPAWAATNDTTQRSWHEDLSGSAVVSVNLPGTGAAGLVTTPTRRLAGPANRLAAIVTPGRAGVTVEARGQGPDGRWSEWVPADRPATLDRLATIVQFRVSLPTGVRVSGLDVRAARVPAVSSVSTRSSTYRLYATREGLVGGRTANGHVIAGRDHFVALPSRRGLNAANGARDYQVQLCYPRTGRCETAPVWDVGPWNTTDDYWNPAGTRQSWTDLPQGRPEAQAAYENGYNGRRDGFGRTVANPAGIDLADGTFWDGLGMTTNDWVDVTFLWT
jgi:hypothetical protein